MLLSFPVILFVSQMVVAVADDVPKFDIDRGCKIDSTSAFDLNSGMSETIKRCVRDEQQAKTQLQEQWSGFSGADRALCRGMTTDDQSIPPSYVERLACLQDQQMARKLPK